MTRGGWSLTLPNVISFLFSYRVENGTSTQGSNFGTLQ
jgi:hypothetical protein